MESIKPDALILGIDLSLNGTGIALIKVYNGQVVVEDTFFIDLSGYKQIGLKLQLLWEEIINILDIVTTYAKEWELPLLVSKERPFVTRKFVSVERLYMCHGILELALWEYNLDKDCHIFSATTIKKLVGGSGKCQKGEVAEGIKHFLMFPQDIPTNNDITDAIAVAITQGIWEEFINV